MTYKIKLREDLAQTDVNGPGFEYEVKEIPNTPDRLLVCYHSKEGNWIEGRYRRSDVQKFISSGEWIKI